MIKAMETWVDRIVYDYLVICVNMHSAMEK